MCVRLIEQEHLCLVESVSLPVTLIRNVAAVLYTSVRFAQTCKKQISFRKSYANLVEISFLDIAPHTLIGTYPASVWLSG